MINLKFNGNEYSIDGEFLLSGDPTQALHYDNDDAPCLSNPIILEIEKDGVPIDINSVEGEKLQEAVDIFLQKGEYFKNEDYPSFDSIDGDLDDY